MNSNIHIGNTHVVGQKEIIYTGTNLKLSFGLSGKQK